MNSHMNEWAAILPQWKLCLLTDSVPYTSIQCIYCIVILIMMFIHDISMGTSIISLYTSKWVKHTDGFAWICTNVYVDMFILGYVQSMNYRWLLRCDRNQFNLYKNNSFFSQSCCCCSVHMELWILFMLCSDCMILAWFDNVWHLLRLAITEMICKSHKPIIYLQ